MGKYLLVIFMICAMGCVLHPEEKPKRVVNVVDFKECVQDSINGVPVERYKCEHDPDSE